MLHKLGLSVAKNPSRLQLGEGEVSRLAIVCAMYQTAINCLSRLNLNILTGKILDRYSSRFFLEI